METITEYRMPAKKDQWLELIEEMNRKIHNADVILFLISDVFLTSSRNMYYATQLKREYKEKMLLLIDENSMPKSYQSFTKHSEGGLEYEHEREQCFTPYINHWKIKLKDAKANVMKTKSTQDTKGFTEALIQEENELYYFIQEDVFGSGMHWRKATEIDGFIEAIEKKIEEKEKIKELEKKLEIEPIVFRQEILQKLSDRFFQDKQTCVVLSGLGGIGKTLIAKMFQIENEGNFDFVKMFDASSEDGLDIVKINDELEEQKNCLLIYDNVKNSETWKTWVDKKKVPRGNEDDKKRMLIISRRQNGWNKRALVKETIVVPEFYFRESIQFLERLVPGNKASEITLIENLANVLGHLPLALKRAGTFITNKGMLIRDYMRYFDDEQNRKRLFWKKETIKATWVDYIDQVMTEFTKTKDILCMFACHDDSQFLKKDVETWVTEKNQLKPDSLEMWKETRRYIQPLIDFSLLIFERETDIYKINPLVQLIVRDNFLNDGEQEKFTAEAKKYFSTTEEDQKCKN